MVSHDPSVFSLRDVSVCVCVCFVYSVVEYVYVVYIVCVFLCGEGSEDRVSRILWCVCVCIHIL